MPAKHKCAARGCQVRVPASRLMCLDHWRMVPADIQRRIWAHYRPGQEKGAVTTSDPYITAMWDAIRAVAKKEQEAAKGGCA